MSQHRHIVPLNVQLSPVCTYSTTDPADGTDVLFDVQFEEEHSPSPRDHKAAHTGARHSAIRQPVRLSHGINPGLCNRCSSCQKIMGISNKFEFQTKVNLIFYMVEFHIFTMNEGNGEKVSLKKEW